MKLSCYSRFALAALALAIMPAQTAPAMQARPRALVIRCTFTEPFATTTLNVRTHDLMIEFDSHEPRTETKRNVKIFQKSPKILEIRDDSGNLIQVLDRNHKGSDGMSEKAYPYDALWMPGRDGVAAQLRGGCL